MILSKERKKVKDNTEEGEKQDVEECIKRRKTRTRERIERKWRKRKGGRERRRSSCTKFNFYSPKVL
jgi:hypothetical protein